MDRMRNAAFVEHVQSVVTSVTSSKRSIDVSSIEVSSNDGAEIDESVVKVVEIDRERLQEAIQLCAELDVSIVPIGLVLAAASVLERQQVRPFLTRLPSLLSDRVHTALGRVSETLLMISDPDLQASGIIAASIFVQRALPDGLPSRDRILESLLKLVDSGFKERTTRHSEVFQILAHTIERPNLGTLPGFLIEISDALEDVACDKDVFLDDPVELVAAEGATQESTEQNFKQVRVRSGADIPMLNDEFAHIDTLTNQVGWNRDQTLSFVSELYERKAMDARTKIGLSVAAISNVVADLKETLEIPIDGLRVEDKKGGEPYTYEWDPATLVVFVGHRGTLSSRLLKDAHPAIVERLKDEKIEREATVLEKAILKYQTARDDRGGKIPSEDEEAPAVSALGRSLGLTLDQTYAAVTALYGEASLPLVIDGNDGITLQGLSDLMDEIIGEGLISTISIDETPNKTLPLTVDRENRTLILHTSSPSLSDAMIRRIAQERSFETLSLAEIEDVTLAGYVDSTLRGSVSVPKNVERFVEEFGLDAEHAKASFEDMLTGCSTLADTITITALRLVIATLNERLGDDGPIDLVAAFYRDLPDSGGVDHSAIAWLSCIEEEDSTLTMLTFNFNYGEGKAKVPPISDEVLLDWCRHYLTKSMVVE